MTDLPAIIGAAVGVLTLTGGALLALRSDIKGWVSDVFAAKADLARLEEQVRGIRGEVNEMHKDIKEILNRIPVNDRYRVHD